MAPQVDQLLELGFERQISEIVAALRERAAAAAAAKAAAKSASVGVGYDEDNGRGGQSDAGRFGAGAGGRRHHAASAAAAASKGPPPWQTVLVSATVTGKVAALAKRLLGGATLVSIDAASPPSQVMAEMGV